MRKRFTKAKDARRRARKAAAKSTVKTGTRVIPNKKRTEIAKHPRDYRYDLWEASEHMGGI